MGTLIAWEFGSFNDKGSAMIKKLLAFAIGAGMSLSASAGYVQYELKDVKFNDGGTATGLFVQDTDSRAILYYEMFSGGASFGNQYFVSGNYANLVSVHTNFYRPGPTSFTSYVDVNDMAWATLALDFSWNAQTSTYVVQGAEMSPLFDTRGFVSGTAYRSITAGSLVVGSIDPRLQASLEAGNTNGIKNLIPAPPPAPADVPEPGSLALLLAGACCLSWLGKRDRRA